MNREHEVNRIKRSRLYDHHEDCWQDMNRVQSKCSRSNLVDEAMIVYRTGLDQLEQESIVASYDDNMAIDNEEYFHRAYRMSPQHYTRLVDMLEPHISIPPKCKVDSDRELRHRKANTVGSVIRYFAGANPDEILQEFRIHGGFPELDERIWTVVKAIHDCPRLSLSFPRSHEEQQEIAIGFEVIRSSSGIDCCVGALGSMVVMAARHEADEKVAGHCSPLCSGLNLQAVCDFDGRFLDAWINHPGEVSNEIAFDSSQLHSLVAQNGFLAPGLSLFANDTVPSTTYITTPASDAVKKEEISLFDHSELTAVIVEAFSDLLRRWSVLRRPLRTSIGFQRQRDLSVALCKLHNFCLDDTKPLPPLLVKDAKYGWLHGPMMFYLQSPPW